MAADRGYIENLKELRSIRIQQIKQMNADQRYHNLQSEYNRRLLRYNELFISNMKDMTSKLGSAIASLSSKLASGVGNAASGVASGVSSLSGSILSGLGKALPFGIAALLAKVLLWDNMSSDTQNRLSSAFGNLMEKLLGPVKGMINKITSGFKSLDVKFPLFDELFDRFTKFFEILQSGFKIISLKFDSMMETFGKDPKKYVKDTLHLLGDAAMLGLLTIVAGKVVLQMFRNHMLLNSIDNLLERRMGGGVMAGPGGRGPTVIAPGGRGPGGVGPRGAGPGADYKSRIASRNAMNSSMRSSLAASESATKSLMKQAGKLGGRLVGALASGPVLTLLSMGFLAYDAYQILRDWGVPDDKAEEAVNMVYPEGFEDVGALTGKISGTLPAKEMGPEIKRQAEEARKRGDTIAVTDIMGQPTGETRLIHEDLINQLHDFEKQQKKYADQLKMEQGKDIAPFVIEDFMAKWRSMGKNEKRLAVQMMYPIVQTAAYVYFMGKDGNIKKMLLKDYKDAILGDSEISEVSKEEVLKKLADLTREGEAGQAGYNAIFKDPRLAGMQLPGGKQVSELTMREVLQVQTEMRKRTSTGEGDPHTPIGGYQFIKTTLFGGRVKNKETGKYEDVKGIVKESEMDRVFDPEFQDELFKRMANKNLEAFLNGDLTKDQFKTYMKNTWEIFQGKNANARVFAERLDDMLDSPDIMQAHVSSQGGNAKTKAERDAEIQMHSKNIDRLLNYIRKPFSNTTPMTVNGVDVVEKVEEEIQDKYKYLRDRLKDELKAVDPEEISNNLINSLKIINEVNQAKGSNKQSSGGDTYNINSVNSSSLASGGSGGSMQVSPFVPKNYYEHNTLSGFSRMI